MEKTISEKDAKSVLDKTYKIKRQNKNRPCRVNTRIWKDAKFVDLVFDGIFHEWGSEAEDGGEHGFGNFSIGIVEAENGQVYTVNPNHIQFTDK